MSDSEESTDSAQSTSTGNASQSASSPVKKTPTQAPSALNKKSFVDKKATYVRRPAKRDFTFRDKEDLDTVTYDHVVVCELRAGGEQFVAVDIADKPSKWKLLNKLVLRRVFGQRKIFVNHPSSGKPVYLTMDLAKRHGNRFKSRDLDGNICMACIYPDQMFLSACTSITAEDLDAVTKGTHRRLRAAESFYHIFFTGKDADDLAAIAAKAHENPRETSNNTRRQLSTRKKNRAQDDDEDDDGKDSGDEEKVLTVEKVDEGFWQHPKAKQALEALRDTTEELNGLLNFVEEPDEQQKDDHTRPLYDNWNIDQMFNVVLPSVPQLDVSKLRRVFDPSKKGIEPFDSEKFMRRNIGSVGDKSLLNQLGALHMDVPQRETQSSVGLMCSQDIREQLEKVRKIREYILKIRTKYRVKKGLVIDDDDDNTSEQKTRQHVEKKAGNQESAQKRTIDKKSAPIEEKKIDENSRRPSVADEDESDDDDNENESGEDDDDDDDDEDDSEEDASDTDSEEDEEESSSDEGESDQEDSDEEEQCSDSEVGVYEDDEEGAETQIKLVAAPRPRGILLLKNALESDDEQVDKTRRKTKAVVTLEDDDSDSEDGDIKQGEEKGEQGEEEGEQGEEKGEQGEEEGEEEGQGEEGSSDDDDDDEQEEETYVRKVGQKRTRVPAEHVQMARVDARSKRSRSARHSLGSQAIVDNLVDLLASADRQAEAGHVAKCGQKRQRRDQHSSQDERAFTAASDINERLFNNHELLAAIYGHEEHASTDSRESKRAKLSELMSDQGGRGFYFRCVLAPLYRAVRQSFEQRYSLDVSSALNQAPTLGVNESPLPSDTVQTFCRSID